MEFVLAVVTEVLKFTQITCQYRCIVRDEPPPPLKVDVMLRYIYCPLELTDLTESSVAVEAGVGGGGGAFEVSAVQCIFVLNNFIAYDLAKT